jgi:hypothetical protein
MKFAIVDPHIKRFAIVDVDSKKQNVKAVAGLGDVDFGVVARTPDGGGIGIMVGEHGLFVPPAEQSYFEIAGKLYAGAAVLYAFDDAGITIDVGALPAVRFFENADDVEAAIAIGQIERPRMAINNVPIWSWPGPSPWGKA